MWSGFTQGYCDFYREFFVEQLEGYVEKILYRNTDNGYTVLELSHKVEELDNEMTCVGIFPIISEGEYIHVSGEYTQHAIYGLQLKVSSFSAATPKSADSIQKYLASGAIKGIGKALADRIVRKFGDKTFEIMEKEPERLAEVKGISQSKAQEIYKQFEEKREARETMLYLQDFGISTNLAVKIYKQYGGATRKIVSENPYKLAEDISGVGFKTADEIAMKVGCAYDSEYRMRAGIIYTLKMGCNAGHTYLPEEVLFRHANGILGTEDAPFEGILDDLAMQRKIYIKGMAGERQIFLTNFYHTELNIARQLIDLNLHDDIDDELAQERILKVERAQNIELDPLQRDAIKMALENSLMIITGGPGTGKTTILKAIIEMFRAEGLSLLLAAPTGRAAKRMSEATGEEARTIHRMLEFMPTGSLEDLSKPNSFAFMKNDSDPLDADVIIIDEASMIDVHLMNALLKAITVGTRVIFTGDARQLPSVGPGNVLDDIIASNAFPVVKLTKIFRQAEESDIIVNAHKINDGIHPTLDNKSKDFFLMKRSDSRNVAEVVDRLVKEKLPKYVNATSFDIQVLTPMRKGDLGVENMNRELQRYVNPPSPEKPEKQHGDRIFRLGDKVMQIKNDYQLEWVKRNGFFATETGLGIFNGDQGIITDVNRFSDTVTVRFDEDREVDYDTAHLEELEHAYAVTVHKSQGSEYPAVVLPLLGGPAQLMTRNLLYTAVTRASKCVVVVGSEDTFMHMIDNDEENKRFTGLKDAIEEIVGMQYNK